MAIGVDDLENAIRGAIPVTHMEIHDMSNGCGENYAILIASSKFEGMRTLARHKFINDVLKEQIAMMHAFSQKTFTPKQYEEYLAKQ